MTPPVYEDRAPAAWIDSNGHMNITYYTLLVTRYFDGLIEWAGLGADYRHVCGATLFVGESSYRYRRELLEGEQVRVQGTLERVEPKRLHAACEIIRVHDETVAASVQAVFVNVGLQTRRAQPFDEPTFARLLELTTAKPEETR